MVRIHQHFSLWKRLFGARALVVSACPPTDAFKQYIWNHQHLLAEDRGVSYSYMTQSRNSASTGRDFSSPWSAWLLRCASATCQYKFSSFPTRQTCIIFYPEPGRKKKHPTIKQNKQNKVPKISNNYTLHFPAALCQLLNATQEYFKMFQFYDLSCFLVWDWKDSFFLLLEKILFSDSLYWFHRCKIGSFLPH